MAGTGLLELPFSEVNVFSVNPTGGNPVAVVHNSVGLGGTTLAEFASWTNLSETTFLLPPSDPEADYRLRIFTPTDELPFAGHPTLGSAHAWLERGGIPHTPGRIIQECGAGLVEIHQDRGTGRLAFAAPPLVRSGPVAPSELSPIIAALGIHASEVIEAAWVDNGPGWVELLLSSPEVVLGLRPQFGDLRVNVGVIGIHPGGSSVGEGGADAEVRAFCSAEGATEDPVTGSLNASLAQWLAGRVLPDDYVVRQGTALGRTGRVYITTGPDGRHWVAGDTRTVVTGQVRLEIGLQERDPGAHARTPAPR